jgi:HEAT repeat protein
VVAAEPAATNALARVPLEELVVRVQRYGSTELKRSEKAAAREEIRRRGPEALRGLMAHTDLENDTIYSLAFELVQQLKAEQAVPVLLPLLTDDQARRRRMAALFLGFYAAPEHAAEVLPLLDSDETAGAAIRTLGKWKVREAVPRIGPFLRHEKEVRRVAAANALRDIGDPAAIAPLIAALEDPFFTVRETAARALVAFGAAAEKPMLRTLPQAQGAAKRCLIRALGERHSWRVRRALRRLRADPDPAVREDAVRALRR